MRGRFTPETKEERLEMRKIYIPKGSIKITPKDVDVVFYLYEEKRGDETFYLAKGFVGTASKPAFHFRFPSAQRREKYLTEFAESKRKQATEKKEHREKLKSARHNWTVGMILSGSWGYDQTNIEYWQVIAISGKQATIQELKQIDAGSTGDMSGYVLAAKDQFRGEPIKKMIQAQNNGEFYISFPCFALTPWDGRKRHQTSYA